MSGEIPSESSALFRRIRLLASVALGVAFVHVVFGAIVRISGSGMGCGVHWPKCYGYWFPPMDRPDLVIEVLHRYLASVLSLTVLGLAFVAWRGRRMPGIAGAHGPLRTSLGALGAVLAAAILGAVTVKYQNAMWATVAHWCVAMTLLALLVATLVRVRDSTSDDVVVSAKTVRGATAAAAVAGLAVAMGGVTAKFAGAPIACLKFPLCGVNPDVPVAATWVQMTHRVIAILLLFHLMGLVIALRKRRATEPAVVVRAAGIAFGFVLVQLLIAGAMIGMKLPPVLRSVHQAVGVSIWISTFAFAYIARVGARAVAVEAEVFPTYQRPSGERRVTIQRPSLSDRDHR